MTRSRPVVLAVTACLAAGALAVPSASAEPAGRQGAYAAAAAEFGVPESVLLGVSYLESRWNVNAGTPSTSAGYGPMHLTDVVTANAGGSHHDDGTEDPRGDDARPALLPTAGENDVSAPALRTVDVAAELTGRRHRDPAQRPRAEHPRRRRAARRATSVTSASRSDDPANWYGAVARYSGAVDTGSASTFAAEVFATINEGVERVTDDGQPVRLRAHSRRAEHRAADRPRTAGDPDAGAECPASLGCEWIPAPYEAFGDGDYGNHDKANRPERRRSTTSSSTTPRAAAPPRCGWCRTRRT